MKSFYLAAAAVSAALTASQADAFDMAAVLAQPNKQAWFTGSSAATPFLEKAFVNDCVAGSIIKFTDASNSVYVCDASTLGVSKLIMYKRDGGGSVTGIVGGRDHVGTFIDTSNNTPFLAINANACPGTTIKTCTVAAGTFTTITHAPSANFSDVDPAKFDKTIDVAGINGSLANVKSLAAAPVATQVFGIAVNLRLRDAMQTAMIAGGALAATCDDSAANRELESCQPILTTAQISSLFAKGSVQDWSQLRWGGAGVAQNLFSAQAAAERPANRSIHICTRQPGSGTLAALNAKFENAPCFAGADPLPPTTTYPNLGETAVASKVVHGGSATGNVEDCLVGLNDAAIPSATSTFRNGGNPVTSTFRWAIGIVGMERNADNSKRYRFVKIDGYSPTAKNVAHGKYRYWAELVAVGNTDTTAGSLSKDILDNMSVPAQIATLNLNNANYGITGFLGYATNPLYPPTFNSAIAPGTLVNAQFDAARPVNPFTHANTNKLNVDHCRVPTVPTGASDRAMPVLN